MKKRLWSMLTVVTALGWLTACTGPTPETITEIVKETIVVEKEVVTEKEVVVTATSAPPQQGGVFIEASSADASTINPILADNNADFAVDEKIFPALLGEDAFTGELVPTELAESWEASEDGLTWTFHLRNNVLWSDGEPVDAADFKFSYEAIANDKVESPRKYITDQIKSIETPDPQTVVVTFNEVRCDGLHTLGLGLLPSHLYEDDFSDIMENKYNEAPSLSAGPLKFKEWVRDDHLTLERNPDYFKGAANIDGWIYKVVPDPGARLGQLQSGEIDSIGAQPEQLTTIELDPNLKLYKFKDDGYDYIALNLANPKNPQPGEDEQGNLIKQEPHPILGEVKVRQAIAYSLDYDAIINKVYLGQGYRMAANVLPAVEWAYDPTLEPYPYDQEKAKQLLEEAGWKDSDDDGIREKDGKKLALNLVTNAGNTTREDMGVLVQDQLKQVGFDITFEAPEFGTMLEQLNNQTFDMIIIGWTGLGSDPNDDAFWHTVNDVPGSGFNFVSYQNPEVNKLLGQGVSVPDCDTAKRAPFYKEIQKLIHDDVPYVFIAGSVDNTAYTARWQGINPGPWSFYHNIEQFALTQ
jgi:peptide/nickel transport system substrate-binding protein